jgi:hypothetical protein
MAWELTIYSPDRSSERSVTQDDASGIVGGFKWTREPNGDCTSLSFDVKNADLLIGARNLVRLWVNNVYHFYGIVTDPPPLSSVDRVTVTAYGGREILKLVLNDSKVYRNMGIYAIVRDILSRLCPPSLSYVPAYIGNGSGGDAGPTLDTFFKPNQSLESVLTTLANSAGVDWSVNALGIIAFGQPAGADLVVGYSGQGFRRLNIEAREVCTEARVSIVTGASLPNGATASYFGTGLPGQIYITATSPENALYHAAQMFTPPEGVALVVPLPYESAGLYNQVSNLAPISDGDPLTSASITLAIGNSVLEVMSQFSRPVGFEMVYEVLGSNVPTDAFGFAYNSPTSATSGPVPQSPGRQTLRGILPPAAPADVPQYRGRFSVSARTASSGGTVQPGELRVYSFSFLHADDIQAYSVAVSHLVSPYTTPAEIKLDYLQAPTRRATITGTPDGDLTGPIAQFEYQHQNDRRATTLVKLGATGQSDTVKAIRFTAQNVVRELNR